LGKVVKLESKPRRTPKLCTRLQSRSARDRVREESPLTPELKAFIDAAIVPALVKQYLAENKFAELDSDAAHSDSSAAKSIRRKVTP
jgi:hypothetical protein